jgi:hypothetical protein
VTYQVTISGGGHNSDEEEMPFLEFSLLTPAEAQVVHDAEARARALRLPADPTAYLIASLYAQHGLNAEAIEQISEPASTSPVPAASRLLGDLYLNVGLDGLAAEQYRRAAALFEQMGDLEGAGLAHIALAELAETQLNPGEAGAQLRLADAAFAQLGDTVTRQKIQKRLKLLP